jgi:hypothetical protein
MLRVQYLLDFKFRMTINDNWRRRRSYVSRNCVQLIRFQQEHVERGMDSERQRQSQSVSLGSDLGVNSEGADVLPIQFLRHALATHVVGQELDFVSNIELDGFVLGVVESGLRILG